MSEFDSRKPTPRRRKPRRPKWVTNKFTYTIWRNWPLIRLILICLLLLSLVFGMVRCTVKTVAKLFDGKSPAQTQPVETEPPETTAPSEEQVQELIDQADALAAGYDYEGAIQLLSSNDHYASTTQYQNQVRQYEAQSQNLVKWEDMENITHIFFHTLIVDNSRCFDDDSTAGGYNQYMTTISEFNKIMQSMYDKGYVLVSPYDIAYPQTDENGNTRMQYGEIWLPEGKKPFLMSQDDVNYYGYMLGDVDPEYERPAVPHPDGDGFAHKIVIGADGYPTCEYMDASGNILTGAYDLVPLLENFIKAHPDFSYRGARAMLGITGYEGVLGYRTKPSYKDYLGEAAYQKECEDAKAVAQCLKDHGWLLVSHSYGHPAYGDIEASRLEADSQKWEDTVQPIIGNSDIILYPFGSDIAGIEKYTFDNAKFQALYDDGYRYFFNVDSHYAWQQIGDEYFRGGRRNLDGYRMYHTPSLVEDLFDVGKVFDPARPTPVPEL